MSENKKTDPKAIQAFKEIYDSLTDEQKEKAKKCKTTDELLKLAAEEGVELPEELLDAAAGGYLFQEHGSKGIEIIRDSDGEYLGSVDTSKLAPGDIMAEAKKQAEQMGQSSEWLYGWDALNNLRRNANKEKGC